MPNDFSLQVVLDYRHSRVQAMEIELGRLQALHQAQQARLALMRDRHSRYLVKLRERQIGDLRMDLGGQLRENLRSLDRAIEAGQAALAALAIQVMAQQQKVVLARQDDK